MRGTLHSKRFQLLAFMLFLIILLFGADKPAYAEGSGELQQWSDQQLDQLDTDKIDAYWQKVVTDYNGFLPETEANFKDLLHSDKESFFKK